MKKAVSTLSLLALLLPLFPGISFCQQVDLSGTWLGTAEVPNMAEPDKLTLILEKKEKGYSGTLSDSMGMIQNSELKAVEFKDKTLSFIFSANTGQEFLNVSAILTVEGDKMNGSWQTEDGSSGEVKLERKK
jgi:hypothetical protein